MSTKIIAKYERNIEEMSQKVSLFLQNLKTVESQISPIDNWSTRVKNGTLRTQRQTIQQGIDDLRACIDSVSQLLQEEKEKKKNFEVFLQPIVDAGFLVYNDGKHAYTAQQLKIIRNLNNVDSGCCLVNPKIFEKASDYFSSLGYSLDSEDLPGDSSLLPENYRGFITSIYSNLHDCFCGITRKLDIVSKSSPFNFSFF
jgi:phage-related protein